MTSRPSSCASAANATSTTIAPRTRICAVVSWRRWRSSMTRRERSAPVTTSHSETAGLRREADDHGDRERPQPGEARDLQDAPAQVLELDLQAREEQQEHEAEERDDGDRLIDVHPPERRGADRDAEHELEDDRRE